MYVLTVTLHLVAMVAWMAPLVAIPAILAGYGPAGPAPEVRARLRGAFRLLATPGLVLTWAFGVASAVQGGFFDAGWLNAKLILVLALSALHGVVAGRLRRIEGGRPGSTPVPALLRIMHWIVLALVAGAVLMAVWKPF